MFSGRRKDLVVDILKGGGGWEIQLLRVTMDRETIKGFFLKRTKLILSGYERNLSQWLIMG